MQFGLAFRERFEGSYYWLDAPLDEHPMRVDMQIHLDRIEHGIWYRRGRIEGEVIMHGLTDGAAEIDGVAGVKVRSRRIPYEFSFRARGRAFRFLGEKDLHPAWLRDSVEVITASLFDEVGEELARAKLRFPAHRQLFSFLRSARVSRARSEQNP
jgi:hypothetical protein